MARPTKYTPETRENVLKAIAAGNTRRAACLFAGIDEKTFANWLARYSDFSDAVKKAEGEAQVRMVAVIQHAASTSWQAAAWWLERRFPRDWGKHEDSGSPVVLKIIRGIDPDDA